MFEKFMLVMRKIQAVVLPFTCVFCLRPSDRPQDLCSACLEDLPIVTQKCPRCAQKLAVSTILLCGTCLQNPPPFAATYSLFAYEAPITSWILDLKFHQQLVYARILGELMADKIVNDWYAAQGLPELVIPVPLHRERLKERGYNQALEIAKPLCRRLGLRLEAQAAKRVKNTAAQLGLAEEKRKQNLKNAFVYEGDLAGKTVAVVDDVMTTGSTLTELSTALLNRGAGRVEVWCCARRSKE